MNTSNTFSLYSLLTRKGYMFFTIILLMLVSTNISAQVTIGSELSPNDGALLDLKQFKGDAGKANSNLGLLLPRIELEAINSLKPCVADPKPADDTSHEGLVVFNVKTAKGFCPGLYVWNGATWSRLYGSCETMSAEVASAYVMDGQDYTFKFSAKNAWTATVTDPSGILDQARMVLSGTAADKTFKVAMNVKTTTTQPATIKFLDVLGFEFTVEINGEIPYLTVANANWKSGVDAETFSEMAKTNSTRGVKFEIPADKTWLTGSNGDLTSSANISDAARTGTIKASINGITGETALEKSIVVSQDKMVISIEVDWLVKKLLFEEDDLPAKYQKNERISLDNWLWGGVADHPIFGSQTMLDPNGGETRFYISTNSKKNIEFVTPGSSGTSLNWVSLAEPFAFQEEKAGLRIHTGKLNASATSQNDDDRKGDIKLKIEGGLEKVLHVEQSVLSTSSYMMENDNPFIGATGTTVTGRINDPLTRNAIAQGYEMFTINSQYVESATYDVATGNYVLKLTPANKPGEIIYGEVKNARISLYYFRETSSGKARYRSDILAVQMDDPMYFIPSVINAPVNGAGDDATEFDIPVSIINDLEISVPEHAKSWLDVSIDNNSQKLVISTTTLNLTGKDREVDVVLNAENTRRSGGRASSSSDKKTVRVIQEPIYLRAESQSNIISPDATINKIGLITNVSVNLIGKEPITASWLQVEVKQVPFVGIQLFVDAEVNMTGSEREYTVVVYVENKSTSEKLTYNVRVVQPAQTLDLSDSSWNADHDGESKFFTLNSNTGSSITARAAESWLTPSTVTASLSQPFQYDFSVDVQPNITGVSRSADVIIEIDGGLKSSLKVTQDPITLTLNPALWAAPIIGGNLPVTVTTNSKVPPIASSNESWLTVVVGADGNLTLTAAANTGFADRNAIVTVNVNGYEKTLPVTQKAKNVTLTVSPETWDAPVDGGNQVITATTNQGTIVMTSNAPAWLTVGADGKTLTATANNTNVDRTTTVTVSNGTLSKDVTVTQKAITLGVSPGTWAAPIDGGNQLITVTTNSTSAITAVSNQTWLTATVGVDKNVTLVATQNLTGSVRNATVTISVNGVSKVVTVTQGIIDYSVTPATWDAPLAGGNQVLTITTTSTTSTYTTTSDGAWLTVGADKKTLTAAANTSGADRNAVVTVEFTGGIKKTVAVTQKAMSLTVTPATWNAPVDGGNQVITATTNHGTITMTSNAPTWLTVGADGKTLTATANNTNVDRTTTVTVSNGTAALNKTVTVTQKAITLGVNPTTWAAPLDGGNQLITVTTNSTSAITAVSNQTWLTATVGADKNVTLVATKNLTAAGRNATVTISVSGISKVVTVTQGKIDYTVTPTTWAAPVGGGNQVLTITTTSPSSTYTTISNAAWLTVGADKKTLTAAANTSGADRSAVVTVEFTGGVKQTVTVTQVAMTLTVTPPTWTVPVSGGSQLFTATTNHGTATLTSNAAWLVKGADGKTFTVAANTTGASRSTTITVSNGVAALNKTVTVSQAAMTLTVTPAIWTVPVSGGNQLFTATTNHGTATLTSNAAWLVKGADGKTFTVAANTTGAARSATITVSNGVAALNKTVAVSQAAMTLTVTPPTWTVPVSGGSQLFTATTNHGTATLTSNAAWLVKGADGKTFTVAANTTGASRSATITVSNGVAALNKTVTVSQAAMTLTVTPAAWTVPINGGSQLFTATTNHGTATLTSNAAWLVKGADGKTFTVAANTTGAARSATITVSNGVAALNKTVTVSQAAMTLTVTPATWAVPINGGSQLFTATTNHGTATLTSNAAWLVKGADGKTFTVAANTTGAARSTTITVSNGVAALNKTVTVSQAAMTLTVTPATWTVPINGGSQLFTATTNHGTATLTSNAAWLVKGADGKTFTVAANTTGASRSATITVSNGVAALNKTVTVSQAAMTLTVTPAAWTVPINGGSQLFTATTNHGTATLTSNAAWLVRAADGKTFTVAANTTGASRSTTITVSNGVAALNKTVTVSQAAMTLTVTPATWAVPINGGSQLFTATTNHGTATLTSNAAWLVKGADGKTFTVAANTTGASRSATITVSNGVAALNKTVTVSQAAMTLTVTPATWAVPINGGSQLFTATTNHGTATLTSNAAWLVKGADGKTFTVAANTTGASRSATITVSNGVAALNKTVAVSQAAMTLTVTPAAWTVPINGGSQLFTATTNHGTATLTSNAAWLVRAADGKTFTVAANTTGASRSATITVSNGVAALNKTVVVSQATMSVTVTPAAWAAPVGGGNTTITPATNYGVLSVTSNSTAWLTVGTDKKTLTAKPNISGATRTGIITVSNGTTVLNKTVTVTQAPVTLTVQSTWNPPAAGEDIILQTSTNYGVARIDSEASWAPWLRRAFDADSKFISALPNTTGLKRTATVIVTNGLLTRSVLITQEPAAFTVSPLTMTMNVDGQTQTVVANRPTITMRSNMGNVGWVTCNNAAKTITAAANNGTTERTAIVTVTSPSGETKQITIKQPGLYMKWATAADGAAIKLGDAGGSTTRKYLTNTKRALESVIVNNANSTVNGSVYQLVYPLSIVNGVYTVQFRPQAIGVPYAQRGAIRSSTAAVRVKGTTVQTAAFTASQDKSWLHGVSSGTSFAVGKVYLLQTLSNVDVMKTVQTPTTQKPGTANFGGGMVVNYVHYYNQGTKQWAVKITKATIPSNIASATLDIWVELVAARPNSFVWAGNGASPLRTTLKINWKKGNKSAFDNENITFTAPTSDEELHLSAESIIQVEIVDPPVEEQAISIE